MHGRYRANWVNKVPQKKSKHLSRMSTMLHAVIIFLMSLLWLYFTFAEYLTTWYGNEPKEMNVFNAKVHGHFSPQTPQPAPCLYISMVFL